MNATLCFGDRHTLNAVHSTLVLQVSKDALSRVCGVRLDGNLNVFIATEVRLVFVENLGLPAL